MLLAPVETATERRRFRGPLVLSCTAALALSVTAARALTSSLDGRVIAAGLVVPLGFALVGQAAAKLTKGGGDVPVRQFRLRSPDGDTLPYALAGTDDDVLRAGDIVRVRRPEPDGVRTTVRELDVLLTLDGPVIRHVAGRAGRSPTTGALVDRLCMVTAILMIAGAAALAVSPT